MSDLPWNGAVGDLPPTVVADPAESEGAQLSGAYPLGWRVRPEEVLASSWLRQVTLVQQHESTVRLEARLGVRGFGGVTGDQFAERSAPDWPFGEPMLVIGGVRGPAVVYPGEADASREEMLRQLVDYGVGAVPAWTVDREHRWTEPSVVAFPRPEEPLDDWRQRALRIARQAGIETTVEIENGTWNVLTLDERRYVVAATAEASVTRDVERRCPMRSLPAAGEYCQMRGGPWTGASSRAATGWKAHRDRLVQVVGCDTCEGVRYGFQGRVCTSGGPLALVPTPIATRWLEPDESRIEH